MQKRYKRTPLSDIELKRLTELEFFYFIQYLEVQFGRGVKLYDIIEVYSFLSEPDIPIMKGLTADVLMNISIVRPATKCEYEVLLWRLGMTAKEIYDKVGTRPNKLYEELDLFDRQEYIIVKPRSNENTYQAIERFMRPVKILNNWQSRNERSPIL